jgi:uncharacterized membrane protein
LNLLTIEWANRGLNFWTVEQGQIPMVTGQAIYPMPVDTINLLDTLYAKATVHLTRLTSTSAVFLNRPT